jgi:hypothetical protein
MTDKLPPIYFYLPQGKLLYPPHYQTLASHLADSADFYWEGFAYGVFCWTFQTYLRLQANGFPCELVRSMPCEGIVLSHRDCFPDNLRPGPDLLMVCLQAERGRHPYAQIHVVQNPQAHTLRKFIKTPWSSYYIPHWPQPGLVPRAEARGDRFENVVFFGNEENLAAELKKSEWQEQLKCLGLSWHVVNRDKWNNYSDTDVVLAVRDFDNRAHTTKPATKLYNAWHAGVPAILGCESAFRAERKNELDYLEVTSPDDAILALKRLRNDKALRHAMFENGRIRAEETHHTKITAQWCRFLTTLAVPAYYRWRTSSHLARETFLGYRYLVHTISKIELRVKRITTKLFLWKKS